MRYFSLSTVLFVVCVAPACVTAPAEHPAVHAESSTVPEPTAVAQDTLRARRIEIVDGSGRARIVLEANDALQSSWIHFLDPRGEVQWMAMLNDHTPGAAGEGVAGPSFVIHGEIGDPGSIYNLMIGARGCALHMGGDDVEDEGGLGFGHMDGESFVTFSARHATGGRTDSASVKLELIEGRIVVRDMAGKELTAFDAPLEQAPESSPPSGVLRRVYTPAPTDPQPK